MERAEGAGEGIFGGMVEVRKAEGGTEGQGCASEPASRRSVLHCLGRKKLLTAHLSFLFPSADTERLLM